MNDIKHEIGYYNIKLFAHGIFLLTNDKNITVVKEEKTSDLFGIWHWCVANKLSLDSEKTHFLLLNANNKTVTENFSCIWKILIESKFSN